MSEAAGVQLDRAEFDETTPSFSCFFCSAELVSGYYTVNGSSACASCSQGMRTRMEGGSPGKRVLLAVVAGSGAALAGAVLYYAILALTGYEFGLIAIAVGFGVGTAVNWGAEGRGGRGYQALAMVLTYLSIVSAYAPMLVTELQKSSATQQEPAPAGDASAVTTPAAVPTTESDVTLGSVLFALLAFAAIICAMPFLAGFQNVIGIIIIGIGLFEAWKLNRKITLTFTGPHTIAVVAPQPLT
jgi:hypothetical protein